MLEAKQELLIDAFVSEVAIEAFCKSILGWFAGLGKRSFYARTSLPCPRGSTATFCTLITWSPQGVHCRAFYCHPRAPHGCR